MNQIVQTIIPRLPPASQQRRALEAISQDIQTNPERAANNPFLMQFVWALQQIADPRHPSNRTGATPELIDRLPQWEYKPRHAGARLAAEGDVEALEAKHTTEADETPAAPASGEKTKDGGKEDEEDEMSAQSCRICLDELKEGDGMRTLPCFHAFHTGCIDEWLKRYFGSLYLRCFFFLSRNATCPICKAPVFPT